jgi:transcriptional regulator with XRE-family HTH domain
MEHEELEDGQQHNLTDLGKLLRSERTLKGDKNAKKMAEALGISEGLLSGIENGNKEDHPDMDFLVRCVDYFGWRLLANDAEEEKRKK